VVAKPRQLDVLLALVGPPVDGLTLSQRLEDVGKPRKAGQLLSELLALSDRLVVLYRGKIAETYFSACSGGHTESVQNVFFGSSVPYLVGVPDPYDFHCPLHKWTLDFSGPEISSRLGGYLQGKLKRVVITKTGVSPRIVSAKLVGTAGTSTVTGSQLSVALGGYDTWMTFQKVVN
jgi:stage II sporulation protein D